MEISIRKIAVAGVFSISSYIDVYTQPIVQSSIDNPAILIGQQINLKVVAELPQQDFFVKWIDIPESLPHFELVKASKIDTVFYKQKLAKLSQTFTFTSFDSGRFTLPAFNIYFNPSSGGKAYNRFTDTFSISVSYQPDSTTVLRDIKDIREVETFSLLQYLLVILAGLVLLALAFWFIYYQIRKRKKITIQQPVSAYRLAITELDKLKQLSLTDAAAVRIYHTRLKQILRTYLSSIHGTDFSSSTTSEVLILLNQQSIDKADISKVAEALRRSDAAGFAKYLPSIQESELSWATIKEAINSIQQLQNPQTINGT